MTSVLPCYPASISPLPVLPELDGSSILQAALNTARDHRPVAAWQTTRSTVGISNLPEELLNQIFQDFDVRGLCTLAQVSPRFRHLSVRRDPLRYCKRRWPSICRQVVAGDLTGSGYTLGAAVCTEIWRSDKCYPGSCPACEVMEGALQVQTCKRQASRTMDDPMCF